PPPAPDPTTMYSCAARGALASLIFLNLPRDGQQVAEEPLQRLLNNISDVKRAVSLFVFENKCKHEK
ncbi:MAG: hypothetical protein ACREQV_08855, partial [Candidatus Binatia bacterium]